MTRVPRILFVKECPYLDLMTASGADVISLGARHDLAAARRQYPHLIFQGNVDEKLLRMADAGAGGRGDAAVPAPRAAASRHIVNLNHGVDRATPLANFEAYVRAAKE